MTVKNIVSISNKKVLKLQGKEKFKKLIENLNTGLIGKEEVIKTSLLSILAQENLILFGPPGTAKSEISRRISSVVDDKNYFEYLLTKFTTPEEIFGPLSIKELKEDRFYRKTEGYLPTAQIGFLDEIFKANSSILNTLLTIMNEKVFHNGSKKEDTDLISLIGASNEDPSNDLELNALYDRFLVRKVVDYIQDNEIDQLFDISGEKFVLNESLKITRKEISDIEENLSKIAIPKDIREVIKKIRLDLKEEFKENNQEEISDRKLVKVLKLLKVSAYTNERDQVDISDILLLKNCLWNNPENQKIVSNIILKNIKEGYKDFLKDNFVIESVIKGVLALVCNTTINTYASKNKIDFKGEGTKINPFLIEDENDLIHMGTENYIDKGYYFKQVNDITIASHWHSIGNEEIAFKGNYDGNSKTISKLNNALFFEMKESIVENLFLKEVDINVELEKAGSIANISTDSCIKNCNIEGNVTTETISIYSAHNGGGIVGYIKGGNIEKCTMRGNVTTSSEMYSYSGGIVGYIEGGRIEKCNVTGDILSYSKLCSSSWFSCGGGIVGYINGGRIEKCNVAGSISTTSSNSYSGGIVGYIKGGSTENCNVAGSIFCSSHSNYYNGGVVGYVEGGSIEKCNIVGSISSHCCFYFGNSYHYTGGIAGYINDGSIEKCNVAGSTSSSSQSSSSSSSNYYNGGVAGKIEGKFSLKKNYINSELTVNDTRLNSSDENSINGKSLDPSHLNEKFYRRLGWDFEKIWYWDAKKNKPALMKPNLDYKSLTNEENEQDILENIDTKGKKDLSKILNDNIWL